MPTYVTRTTTLHDLFALVVFLSVISAIACVDDESTLGGVFRRRGAATQPSFQSLFLKYFAVDQDMLLLLLYLLRYLTIHII